MRVRVFQVTSCVLLSVQLYGKLVFGMKQAPSAAEDFVRLQPFCVMTIARYAAQRVTQ
jgi:hypothetical protein